MSSKDGLVAGVHSILKSSDGYMWFGTMSGLYRYDGKRFKIYTYHPDDSTSISGTYLESDLFEDSYGTLWVGTAADGLNRYNRHSESFQRYNHNPADPKSLGSNSINCIYEDRDKVLWIGTHRGLNKFNRETGNFTRYIQHPDSLQHNNDYIQTLFEDNKGIFYVGTTNGLFIFDRNNGKFTLLEEVSVVPDIYKNVAFRNIVETRNGILWMATNTGLLKYNSISKKVKRYETEPGNPLSLHDNDLFKVLINPIDNGKSFWLSTSGGLSRFDLLNETFHGFIHEPNNPNSLSGNIITSLYIDNTGILWIANESFGLDILNLNKSPFKYYDLITPTSSNTYTNAKSFHYDDKGELWVGSHTDGLFRFNKEMELMDWYNFDPYQQNAFTINFIRFVTKDSNGDVWAGTSGDGIYKLNPINNTFEQANITKLEGKSLVWVYRMFEDSKKTLWFLLNSGIYYREDGADSFISLADVTDDAITRTVPFSIAEDQSGNIWISSREDGLYKLSSENRPNFRFKNYQHNPNDSSSLSSNVIRSIYCDNDNNVWIGSSRGLNLYNSKNDSFTLFDGEDGLPANIIYHIEGDKRGRLWMTTEKGLISYDRTAKVLSRSKLYELQDNMPFDNMFLQYFYKNKDGRIYIGGRKSTYDGFFCFYPDSLESNSHIPPIVITDFKIKNEPVLLDSSISEKKQLQLKYNENFFSFEFAALDFVNPGKNEYAYMLDGLEEKWNYNGNRTFANYTGIPPGSYTFRVKGSNNDSLWNLNGTSIKIDIAPPWWRTWWAYSIYFIIAAGIFYGWRRYDLNRQQLKKELELEHIQMEKMEEVDRMKSQFFANISHEFRTPLTLILGPLDKVISRVKDKDLSQDLDIMDRNAKRLQNLINQLLSLSKLESGKMKLHIKEENIVQLVSVYAQSFSPLAQNKNIDFRLKSNEKDLRLFVDRDKIEKVITNLLSNAFKFTENGGKITLTIKTFEDGEAELKKKKEQILAIHKKEIMVSKGVKIAVTDSGRGIAKEKLGHIFDRFYQAHESTNGDSEGTGIGLALTKELVELHHGVILPTSILGEGTTFNIYLPSGTDHLDPDQIILPSTPGKDIDSLLTDQSNIEVPVSDQEISEEEEVDSDTPIVLIVEDNPDMRLYIKGYLEDKYTIIEAENGETGLKKAIDHVPDLVISDVMMPVMNGVEMCKKIKSDHRTSHIPIIILTAKASTESKIEGLETGADAFLIKPFDAKELQIRIKNLIEQRNNLRQKFISKLDTGVPIKESGIAPMDQKFLEKAREVVHKNMSDSDFSVQLFCQEMAMSRVQLHRKLTAITNHSTSRFIRSLRLKRAAEMLSERIANVSEVAYDVGFSNLSWFAKCFHEQYGVPPSDYYSKK